MAPYMPSTSPDRVADVGKIEWTLKNVSGGTVQRGDIVAMDFTTVDAQGRFTAFDDLSSALAPLVGIIGVVQEEIRNNQFGHILIQGFATHVRISGTINQGSNVGVPNTTNGIIPSSGSTGRKVVFFPSGSYTSGNTGRGFFDGWGGFGKDSI